MTTANYVTMIVPIIVALVTGGFAYLQARRTADRNARIEARKVDLSEYESLNRALREEIDKLRSDRVEDWAAHRESVERLMDELHELARKCKEETKRVVALEEKVSDLASWARDTISVLRRPDVAEALSRGSVTIPPPRPWRADMARWNDYTEPARIRAVALAIVQLAAALGLVLPFDLPGIAEALIAVLAAVLPLVTGELIRAKVTPVGRHAARD